MDISLFGIKMTGSVSPDVSRDNFATAPVRTFNNYIIAHIYAGRGRLRLEDSKVEMCLHAGDIVIIEPNTANIYGSTSGDDYGEDYIFISGWAVEQLAAAGLLKTGCYSFVKKRKLPQILALGNVPLPESQLRAKIMLKELLVELRAMHRHNRYARIRELLDEFRKNPAKIWSIGEMAKYCQLSSSQFRRNFIACTGMLPKECIEGIKMQLAAEKLMECGESIDKICQRLGYDDRFHFSRRFRIYYGMPPGEFRKRAIGKSE